MTGLIELRNRLSHDDLSALDKEALIVDPLYETGAGLSPLLARSDAFIKQRGLMPTTGH